MKQLNFSPSAKARRGEVRWWSIIFFHLLMNHQHHWACQHLTHDKHRGASTWRQNWSMYQICRWNWDFSNPNPDSLARNISVGPDRVLGYPFPPPTTAPTVCFLLSLRCQTAASVSNTHATLCHSFQSDLIIVAHSVSELMVPSLNQVI